jgi:hypothetical protein
LDITATTLGRVESLGELGLTVGRLHFLEEHGVWLTEAGRAKWREDRVLADEIRAEIRKYLRRLGVVPMDYVRTLSALGRAYAWSSISRLPRGSIEVGNYLIPTIGKGSALERSILEMLAVAPELGLADIHAGLRQRPLFRELPPEVITAVVCHHPSFALDGDRVRPTSVANLEAALSPSERAAVTVIKQAGGLVLWNEFVEGVERLGFSKAMAVVLLKKPFIVRPSTALYALRGLPVPPELLRRKLRERRAARAESIITGRWFGVERFEVRYRLTSFTVQGVLGMPPELRKLRIHRWSGRLPNGTDIALRSGHGLLWSLRTWFQREGAQVGDVLVATFFLAERRVEFNDIIRTSEVG